MTSQLPQLLPLLLNARQAGQLLGCSEAQVNKMLREGTLPRDVLHPAGYGGWRKFSRIKLEQWAAGNLHTEAAS